MMPVALQEKRDIEVIKNPLSEVLPVARVFKGKTGVRVSVRFASPSSLESACHAILRRKKAT